MIGPRFVFIAIWLIVEFAHDVNLAMRGLIVLLAMEALGRFGRHSAKSAEIVCILNAFIFMSLLLYTVFDASVASAASECVRHTLLHWRSFRALLCGLVMLWSLRLLAATQCGIGFTKK